MATVNYFYAEDLTRRTRTGSTTYAAPTGGSGVSYIPGSSLAANTKYLVIAKAVFGGDAVNGLFGLRLTTADEVLMTSRSQFRIEPTTTATTEGTVFLFVHSYSTDSSPADIGWEFATLASASDEVWMDQASITLIDLDDVGTANYEEDLDAGGSSIGTTSWGNSGADINGMTYLEADTEYLILGYQQIQVDDNKSNVHVRLAADYDADATAEQLTYCSFEGEDVSEERLVGVMGRCLTGSGTRPNVLISAYADVANDFAMGSSYLIAIKTEVFEDFEHYFSTTGRTVGSGTEVAGVDSYTPTTDPGDHLVVGRFNYTTGGAASRVSGSLYDGSLGNLELMAGDSGVYQTQVWDPTDAEQVLNSAVESITGNNNVKMKGTTHTSDTDVTSEYEFLAVLSLELASTGTNYNETGRAASFDALADSSDTADFLDNRSAVVEMTSASTDGASFSESLSVLVEFTTSSTEGLSYEETDLAVSVDITVASTDDAGFLDAVAAAIDLSSVAADTATLIDSASATADLTTSSTDDLSVTEAAAALVDFTTAVTDALTYPETGLFALVDLTTLSDESVDFADELAALVEFTADSTDVYTGGGTNYDETGRSALFDATTASTENLSASESRSALADYTADSSDTQGMTASVSAAVDLTTDSTDAHSFVETGRTALVELTTASSDSVSFADELAATVDVTTASSESVSFADSGSALVDLTTTSTDTVLYAELGRSALVDFTVDSSESHSVVETGSATVDLTVDSSDSLDATDSVSALVEFTADSTDIYSGDLLTIIEEQTNSAAGTGATAFTASFDSAPTADNLIVIIVAGGTVTSLDSGQGTWTEALLLDDRLGIWYKIADGDATDDDIDFSMTSSNQYAWAVGEYSANEGWLASPLDKTASDGVNTDDDNEQTSGTTGTTVQADELAIAGFRIRDDDAAISGDSLTNSFEKSEAVGTEFGFAYSLEIYTAWEQLSATGAIETTLSWTSGVAGSQAGIIATFKPAPVGTGYDETGRSASFDVTADSTDSQGMSESVSATVETTTSSSDTASLADSVSALVEFTADSTDILSGVYNETGRSASVDLTTSSTDTATLTDEGRTALVEFTADASHTYYGQFVTREQEDAGAGSGSSWQASLPVAPTAGNLLVVACAAGAIMTIDPSETTWIYADGADIDNFALWYKIADGDATDNDVDFSIALANQYAWVMAEYEAINGWKAAPLDVTAHDGVNSGDASSQTSGTTATTAQDEELLFAIFRLRDDDAAISGDALTNDFGKVDSAGTEFGNAWSMEIYAADSLVHSTGTMESTLSWTSGDTGYQAGLIATFMPEKITYDETGRSAQVEFATASSEVPSYDETGRAAAVELTTTSNDHKYSLGTYNETDRSALVELQAQVTDTLTAVESQSAQVDLTADVAIYNIIHPVSGSGSVAGAPSSVPSATGASGVPSATPGRGLPSATGRRGTPGAAASEVQD